MTAATVRELHPRPACVLRDDRFVDPCSALATEPFELVQQLDPRGRQPTRSFVGVWSAGALRPLRVCPFCGVNLPGGAA